MDKELIREVINYIEGMTEQRDAEYGDCRNFKEIAEDDYDKIIPDIYFKLKNILDK